MSELFQGYEINNQPRGRRVLWFLVFSIVTHGSFLAAVVFVPGVRDLISTTSALSRLRFVDRAYKKTHIGDGSGSDIIDLADARFSYPPGYFSTLQSAPEAQPTPTPAPTPKQIARPMRKGTKDGAPDGVQDPKLRVIVAGTQPGSPQPPDTDKVPGADDQGKPKDLQETNKELDALAAANDVNRVRDDDINRLPLKEWLVKYDDAGVLDLTKEIEVVIDAELDANGKFSKANVVKATGDNPEMKQAAVDFIAALNDSGMLQFLMSQDRQPLALHGMHFVIRLDQAEFTAEILTETSSPERAAQLATTFNIMLGGVQYLRADKPDEIAIANGTRLKSDGKKLIANFKMTRQQAADLLKKQVAAARKLDPKT